MIGLAWALSSSWLLPVLGWPYFNWQGGTPQAGAHSKVIQGESENRVEVTRAHVNINFNQSDQSNQSDPPISCRRQSVVSRALYTLTLFFDSLCIRLQYNRVQYSTKYRFQTFLFSY